MTYETPVATAPPVASAAPPAHGQGVALGRRRGAVATVIMALLALLWLFPLLWALINSFREYDYTQIHGYLSFGGWTFDNYEEAQATVDKATVNAEGGVPPP